MIDPVLIPAPPLGIKVILPPGLANILAEIELETVNDPVIITFPGIVTLVPSSVI